MLDRYIYIINIEYKIDIINRNIFLKKKYCNEIKVKKMMQDLNFSFA